MPRITEERLGDFRRYRHVLTDAEVTQLIDEIEALWAERDAVREVVVRRSNAIPCEVRYTVFLNEADYEAFAEKVQK